jgi:hypothetical protein
MKKTILLLGCLSLLLTGILGDRSIATAKGWSFRE